MKPIRYLLACCLTAMAGSASAVTYETYNYPGDSNPISLGTLGDLLFNVNQTGSGVDFTHYFRFTTQGSFSGLVAGAFVTPIVFGSATIADIAALSMGLYVDDGVIDGTDTLLASDILGSGDSALDIMQVVSAGNYYLKIEGSTASGPSILGGAYSAGITVSPVPEAETWAMMAAGLGLVGMQLRRRTRGGKLTS